MAKKNKKEIRVLDKNKPLIPFLYQAELIKKTIHAVNKSDKRAVFTVSPPGSGKTLIMATIAKLFTDKGKRVMFMVHRTEIIEQAKATFKRQGVDMDLVKFGMVQTLSNREKEVKDFAPNVLFTDEAHHAAAATYMRVISWVSDAYKFYFTATPWRGDGKGFEELANNDDLVLGPSVNWLIENEYLSDFDYYIKTLYDKSALKVRAGDYTNKSIEEQAKNVDINQIVDTYIQRGNNEPAIVYAGSIEQSKNIVDLFNQRGIKAAHLDGSSRAEDRKQKLDDFKNGKIKVISNVQIFTEGVDLPDASIALIARPTRSVALYYQFSMRVLRYKEGKRAKIIDFAGVANDLGLPNADRNWSLLSRDVRKAEIDKQPYLFECDKCHKTFSSSEVIKKTEFTNNKHIIVKIYCPEDNNLIEIREADECSPEMVEIQEILNKEEFAQSWYKNAVVARDQDLKMNAKIIKTQNPKVTNTEIFVQLLKTYLPNFSRNTPYEKVQSVKKFPEHEIDSMIEYLGGDGKDKDLFIKMFNTRKGIVTEDYANKIDLTEVEKDHTLIDLFKEKVKMVKREAKMYGERVTTKDVIIRVAEDIARSVKQNRSLPYKKQQIDKLKEFCIRLRRLTLINKQDADDLYKKSIEALNIINSDQRASAIRNARNKRR